MAQRLIASSVHECVAYYVSLIFVAFQIYTYIRPCVGAGKKINLVMAFVGYTVFWIHGKSLRLYCWSPRNPWLHSFQVQIYSFGHALETFAILKKQLVAKKLGETITLLGTIIQVHLHLSKVFGKHLIGPIQSSLGLLKLGIEPQHQEHCAWQSCAWDQSFSWQLGESTWYS